MSKLKTIKTPKGELSFEGIESEFLFSNYFEVTDKSEETRLLKVCVLLGHNGKSELLNSIKDSEKEFINDEIEPIYYGVENIKKALDEGAVVICDDVNWSAPYIEELIQLFLFSETNPKHAQLLFATNVTGWMKFHMRTDQIWIVDNDELFSVVDFEDVQIGGFDVDAWYNACRFSSPPTHNYLKNKLGITK